MGGYELCFWMRVWRKKFRVYISMYIYTFFQFWSFIRYIYSSEWFFYSYVSQPASLALLALFVSSRRGARRRCGYVEMNSLRSKWVSGKK